MQAEGKPNLRARNKARVRAEIAEVALRLFGERGFDNVTVDEIVAVAGVSRRTFFRYFMNKEEALLADYPELNFRLTESLDSSRSEGPLEAVRTGLHQVVDWYAEHPGAVLERSRVIQRDHSLAARNLEFLSQWERAIASTIAGHMAVDPASLVPRTAAAALVAAFRAALTQWVRSSGSEDLHELTDQAVRLVSHGIEVGIRPGKIAEPS